MSYNDQEEGAVFKMAANTDFSLFVRFQLLVIDTSVSHSFRKFKIRRITF